MQGRGRVAEVRGPHQVDLAHRGLVAPDHLGRAAVGGDFLALHGVVAAEHVAVEVLGALGGGAQQVRAPVGQHAREVLRVARVLDGEPQAALLELLDDVVLRRHTCVGRLLAQGQRVAVECGVGGHPAAAGGLDQGVRRGLAGEGAFLQRRGQALGVGAVVAPLLRRGVPEAGGDHLARRALPVQRERVLRPAGDRADLLLADVVRPAAAVDALAAGHGGQRQERAVDRVRVEVVVRARAHDDHGLALGLDGVPGELAADADRRVGRHAGVLLLPRRGARGGGVVVVGRPLAGQALAGDGVAGEHEVEDRGDQVIAELERRHAARDHARAHRALRRGVARQVEAGQQHLDGFGAGLAHGGHGGGAVVELEVPLALARVAPAVGHRAARVLHRAVFVEDERTEFRVGGVVKRMILREIRGRDELARHVRAVAGGQPHEEGRVRVPLHVLQEARRLLAEVELFEDDVAHRQRQRAVRARVDAQPLVGELRVVRVVRRHRDDLLAVVAGLGHEVRVRGAGQRDVRAPHDQVARVEPVRRLRDVGLVAEDLRGGHRQVRVPVVERQHRAADQLVEAGAGAVGQHRHRRDDREAGQAVRAEALDRVHVRGGDDLHRLVPRRAHQAALAAGLLVRAGALRVLHDVAPRQHRVLQPGLRLAPVIQQRAADVREADAGGRVRVPGERRAARAAAGLVLRHVRADGRVIGLLGLPGDHAVLDVDLPRAGARAVDAVRGADDLVVAPPLAVEAVRVAAALEEHLPRVLAHGAAAELPAQLEQGIRRAGSGGRAAVGGGHSRLQVG